jgi:hypothetical protein
MMIMMIMILMVIMTTIKIMTRTTTMMIMTRMMTGKTKTVLSILSSLLAGGLVSTSSANAPAKIVVGGSFKKPSKGGAAPPPKADQQPTRVLVCAPSNAAIDEIILRWEVMMMMMIMMMPLAADDDEELEVDHSPKSVYKPEYSHWPTAPLRLAILATKSFPFVPMPVKLSEFGPIGRIRTHGLVDAEGATYQPKVVRIGQPGGNIKGAEKRARWGIFGFKIKRGYRVLRMLVFGVIQTSRWRTLRCEQA